MKTQLFLSLATAAILTVSCGEKSDNTYEDSVEAQNEMSGAEHASDTNMVKRDGTILSGAMDISDSVKLPSPILDVIETEDEISVDKIRSKRKFEENGITYYEISFMTTGNQPLTIIYDEDGKKKPIN